LWSWAVYETALHPAFADDVPYVFAAVALDEGPFLFSNIVRTDPAQLAVGCELIAVFDEVAPDIKLVRFCLKEIT
jgi:hypothetical protein